MDSLTGNLPDPLSLNRYLYANADPVNHLDPTGHFTVQELQITALIVGGIGAIGTSYAVTYREAAIYRLAYSSLRKYYDTVGVELLTIAAAYGAAGLVEGSRNLVNKAAFKEIGLPYPSDYHRASEEIRLAQEGYPGLDGIKKAIWNRAFSVGFRQYARSTPGTGANEFDQAVVGGIVIYDHNASLVFYLEGVDHVSPDRSRYLQQRGLQLVYGFGVVQGTEKLLYDMVLASFALEEAIEYARLAEIYRQSYPAKPTTFELRGPNAAATVKG